MKKQLILLFVAVTCFAVQGYSQLSFGPIAGVNYSILSANYENSADEPDENDPATGIGFHLGAVADYCFGDQIGVRSGLVFSQRGVSESFSSEFEFAGETTKTEVDTKSSYNYLEIPTFLTYTLGGSLTVFAGPQFGILAGAKHSVDSSVTVGGETTSESTTVTGSDATEGVSALDIDIVGGVQVNMENGVNVGVRYGHGITPVNEEFTNIVKTTWGVLALTVGFTL